MPQPNDPALTGVARILSRWQRSERALAVLALSLILMLILGDVLMRELVAPLADAFGIQGVPSGVYAAQQRSLYLLVVVAFLGIGLSVATAGQIVPTVAFGWVPKRLEPLIERLSHLVSAAIMFAVCWYGWLFVRDSMEYPTLLSGLNWPAWVVQSVIPLGFLSAGLRYLAFAIWPATAPARPEVQE
jgi:TRAP-type C4-dicarboxylate transport system permease small subunit